MLNQAVLTLERLPDTLQKDHIDYGFRVLGIYGSDYKYTIANNLLSNSYLKDHKKYDFNPAFFYGDIYIPYIAKGLNIRTGHYISIPDIETQLAPTNYTYSHSLTYSFVPFSHDGVVSTLKFNKNWMAQFEISAGSDVSALDTKNRKFTPGGCVSYTTDSGNDNFYPCINGINNGRYAYNNVQDLVATWYHKFNEKWHTYTQGYYMWQKSVPSVSDPNAPPTINGSNGAYCRNGDATCRADAFAGLNYLVYKFHPKDFITFRNEFLKDTQGQRSGYKTLYTSHLISWSHWIGDVITIRPELRFDHSYNAKAYDNGQKSNLYVFATDMIIHF
jgi:hypothetical protein